MKKVERNPRYSILFYKMVQECRERCTVDKKIQYYKKAIYHDPHFAKAYYALAVIYEQGARCQKAVDFYKKVVELDPEHAPALFKVGVYYFKKEEFDLAEKYFNRAAKISYNFHDFYYFGWLCALNKDYNMALWNFRRCLAPDSCYFPKGHLASGIVLQLRGAESSALAYVNELKSLGKKEAAEQLREFIETGKYPKGLPRINLTHSSSPER